jgi:hypothetical protein
MLLFVIGANWGWVPRYNERFQTSCEQVFLAGHSAGMTTQGAILITGKIAGVSVSEPLGGGNREEANHLRSSLWKELEVMVNS